MAFMLGSFMDGLLGGAKSVASIYGAYQGIARANEQYDRAKRDAAIAGKLGQSQDGATQQPDQLPTDLGQDQGPVAPDYTQEPLDAPAPAIPTTTTAPAAPNPAAVPSREPPAASAATALSAPPATTPAPAPTQPSSPVAVASAPNMGGMKSGLLTGNPATPLVSTPAAPNPDQPGPIGQLANRVVQGINTAGTGTAPSAVAAEPTGNPLMTGKAPAAAPAAGTQPTTPSSDASSGGLGSWLLHTLNPIGSAHAAGVQNPDTPPGVSPTIPGPSGAPTEPLTNKIVRVGNELVTGRKIAPVLNYPTGDDATPPSPSSVPWENDPNNPMAVRPAGPAGYGLDATMTRLRNTQGVTTGVKDTAPALTPQSAPSGVTVTPAKSDKVAPAQQGPTVASQPPQPASAHPQFDTRPYKQLAQHAPQYKALVDKIAAENHIDPARLALHWGLESGLRPTAPPGKAGEIGPLQIMPQTAAQFDPHHTLDPAKLPDALELAARDIAYNDSQFGRNTVSSVAAYNAGTNGVVQMAQGQPNAITEQYINRAFPRGDGHVSLTPPINVDARGVVQATLTQGPVGGLRALWATAPKHATSEDLYNTLETDLVRSALEKGDLAGAMHARDFVFQLMHGGAVASTMHAYQALQAGDGAGAAKFLAQAHAFVPDGMVGEFGVDKSGAVFGHMKDERTGKPVGGFFQVTPQKLLPLLMETRDPQKFMQMVSQQQQAGTAARLADARISYLGELVPSRERIAAASDQTRLDAARIGAGTRLEAAQIGAQSRENAAHIRAGDGGIKPSQMAAEVSKAPLIKELQATDPRAAGYASQAYTDLRTNNALAPQMADHIATGLVQGQYKMVPGADGQRVAVMDAKGGTHPLAYLTMSTARQLMNFMQPSKAAPAAAVIAQRPTSALPVSAVN